MTETKPEEKLKSIAFNQNKYPHLIGRANPDGLQVSLNLKPSYILFLVSLYADQVTT